MENDSGVNERSLSVGDLKMFREKVAEKLKKLEILLTTDGAFKARRAGIYFEYYKMLHDYSLSNELPKTIFDIGANRGMFSKSARYVFPNAFIYAFEPLKNCFDELQSFSKTMHRIECFNVALSDKQGSASIHKSNYDYSSSLLEMDELHKNAYPFTAREVVETIQIELLDSIMQNKNIVRPALMKVDVQGYELFVLQGAKKTLEQTDAVICEMSFRELYKGQALFDEVYNFLVNVGFQFSGHVGELRNPKNSELLQIDGLFVRR